MLHKKYLTTLIIILSAVLLHAQQVIKPGNLSGSLQAQFENVFKAGKTNDSFWIGYSISRNDDRGIFIGSYYDYNYGISLREIIMNGNPDLKKQIKKKRRFTGRNFHISNFGSFEDGTVPDKETAILFRYDDNSKGINDFVDVGICNLAHNFDIDNSSLIWLGKKDNTNSVEFLFGLYNNARSLRERENLLGGISIHSEQVSVTSFLVKILNGGGEAKLRKNAAIWLGLQNNNTALAALKNAINNDPVSDVRQNSVYGIGFMDLPGIVDELVNIARYNSNRDVRKSAIYALGNKAVKNAEEALKNFIENDPDVEIKKSAVYALMNCSGDNIPYLIEIAKTNKSIEIRKAAIYSLGNSDDERAFDALVELAKK